MMYFDTYEEAKEAAIKQSKGRLTDCKLYIKLYESPSETVIKRILYKISFTPENIKDAYIYNGEIKND